MDAAPAHTLLNRPGTPRPLPIYAFILEYLSPTPFNDSSLQDEGNALGVGFRSSCIGASLIRNRNSNTKSCPNGGCGIILGQHPLGQLDNLQCWNSVLDEFAPMKRALPSTCKKNRCTYLSICTNPRRSLIKKFLVSFQSLAQKKRLPCARCISLA